ncbi:dTDP-4-amino-4,6-dideoxygalactose transaminase [Salinarimonas rosea]|uniref:dTDP-4-amino-4,6-dideoxygalactose transaminase n=1 Tax=Salinarimonas rosea TaxID=552063 RepID=UPI0004151496|nr:dTDP-4-amino-4,6-dideoxygalactose transaminase [Salinarimonas rosea]
MIPLHKPLIAGREAENVAQALASGRVSGHGPFTLACQDRLRDQIGSAKVLLTHSCTAALEMSAMLADVGPGDEVIMPSFTFVSTANAFVLRGATPVFVDIREDTLNLNEAEIERAIGPRTRAICVVHYAGVGADMAAIEGIARRHGLTLIEDAAQGLNAWVQGRPLGSIGALAALSFHETKNVVSGEGGALLVNDPGLVERAEIIWEKGTDRTRFVRGEVDKYTWIDIGSSYLPSDIVAAVLLAQLDAAPAITAERRRIWRRYDEAFAELVERRRFGVLGPPSYAEHNAHIFALLLRDETEREALRAFLKARGIGAASHYVPLHSAPAGRRFGRESGRLSVTEQVAGGLLRLPLFAGMGDAEVDVVIAAVRSYFDP